jgi:uncharacterized protein YndB with AHSA1/START domain
MEEHMQLANVSDEAVKAKTGHDWTEWLEILDAAGAKEMTHKAIVAILTEKHAVSDWWCQMVTVGYEQARGLREKYEKLDGYEGSASKTISRPISVVYNAWIDESIRKVWFGDQEIQIKKSTPDRSIRIAWLENQSSVDVQFYTRGEEKSQVTINHGKLNNQDEVNQIRQYWGEALARLKALLEKG